MSHQFSRGLALVLLPTFVGCAESASSGAAPAGASGSAGASATNAGGSTSSDAGTGATNVPLAGSSSGPSGGSSSGGAGTSDAGRSSGGLSGSGASGGTSVAAGAGGAVGGSSCEAGHTTTDWASGCKTTASATCVAGTWQDPGSTTNDPLACESAHFAVHSPSGTITAAQCQAATSTLETVVWPTFFGSPLFFPEPYCGTATKWKASIVIHADYGLTGGGWGNGYMGMWIGPGATADHWGLAHEFTHAVQSQSKGLACNSSNTCGWIYESHANWQAHQLPEYRGDVHCSEMLANAPHLYLGSTRDRYCNWQFMEFLKDKYCYEAVNQIWTAPKPSNDPFTNIAVTRGWTTSQLNDFFAEWATHNVTWDYKNPPPTIGDQGPTYRSKYGSISDTTTSERRLRTTRLEALDLSNRTFAVPSLQAPQRWGYDVVRLFPDTGATHVAVNFRGIPQVGANSDWRWGLVATDSAITTPRYSSIQRGADGALDFCVNPGQALFLVVMATPSVQQQIVWDQPYPTIYRYPYTLKLGGAQPEGYQPGAANPSPSGKRWSNGNGWVASGAAVADGAYVGPYATVLGGTVAAAARIEDHALLLGGTVSGGTVGGLTVMTAGMTVSGNAQVRLAWPYGPGWFEKPQQASGTTQLLFDLEYRGAGTDKASGAFCGFVDEQTKDNCSAADVTTPPPYAFRP